jgi:hypothetical protein
LSLRSDNFDSVDELYTEDDLGQLVVTIETAPALLSGLGQFESHGERYLLERHPLDRTVRWRIVANELAMTLVVCSSFEIFEPTTYCELGPLTTIMSRWSFRELASHGERQPGSGAPIFGHQVLQNRESGALKGEFVNGSRLVYPKRCGF